MPVVAHADVAKVSPPDQCDDTDPSDRIGRGGHGTARAAAQSIRDYGRNCRRRDARALRGIELNVDRPVPFGLANQESLHNRSAAARLETKYVLARIDRDRSTIEITGDLAVVD